MEHKSWLWRRTSSEKTISSNEKSNLPFSGKEQEKQKTLELERSLEDLREQLYSVCSESNAKDDLLAKQAKVAEESAAGCENAKTEVESVKKELANVLRQKAVAEDKLAITNADLKGSLEQLRVVKEEHKHNVADAAAKISRAEEKARVLEKRLAETNNGLAKLSVENSNLRRILEIKEKLIEEIIESKSHTEASFTAILETLDSLEKDNSSLKYEICMLQKELEIRNQDRDFHVKSADAARKKNLANMKKIARLESECQRLRVMIQKRLPGPAAIPKIRSEFDIPGDGTPTRKKETTMSRDYVSGINYDSSSKRVASLVERLDAVEDENKILKEALVKKSNELQSSRINFAKAASKLSQAETQLRQIGLVPPESARSTCLCNGMPLASIPEDDGNENAISCAETWASALISELENFRHGKARKPSTAISGASELSLMDDFIEMERLATVHTDKQSESSNNSGEMTLSLACRGNDLEVNSLESTGKELVSVDDLYNQKVKSHELCSPHNASHPSWLQDILQVIVQKHHITNKSLDIILEEVSIALGQQNFSIRGDSSILSVSSISSQEINHKSSNSLDGVQQASMLRNEIRKQHFLSDYEKPLCKLIELIEGIIQRSFTNGVGKQLLAGKDEKTNALQNESYSFTGQVGTVRLWGTSDLCNILQHFAVVCNDLLHGKADFEKFTYEMGSTLELVIKHCILLQDLSSREETVNKLIVGDESHGNHDPKVESSSLNMEKNKNKESQELNSKTGDSLSLSTLLNKERASQTGELVSELKDENIRLISEIRDIKSKRNFLEERLQLLSAKNEYMSTQAKESEERISKLQEELMTLKFSNRLIEDQVESQKLITEDLGTQLTMANARLSETRQKFCSLEVELDDKNNCCEELEAACLELQLQLESVSTKETPEYENIPKEEQLRTEWKISAASEKLAECQATILDLGKQLKALAAPEDAALFGKVASPPATRVNNHLQLLDPTQTEDESASEYQKSPKTKEIICAEIKRPLSFTTSEDNPNAGLFYGRKLHANTSYAAINLMNRVMQPSPVKLRDDFDDGKGGSDVGRLAIVPKRRKRETSFLKKLLSRKKKQSCKK